MRRNELVGAEYNPRKLSKPARQRLQENIKRVGLLGPSIVWNRKTGHVVSGHQRLSILDALEGGEDYLLDVTAVDWSESREREQNVFMNSPDAQGEWDGDLLAQLLQDTEVKADWERAGLDRLTVEVVFADAGIELGSLFGDETTENEASRAYKAETAALKATIAEAKRLEALSRQGAEPAADEGQADAGEASGERGEPEPGVETFEASTEGQEPPKRKPQSSVEYARERAAERVEAQSYVTLVFDSMASVRAFLERCGLEPGRQYVDGHVVAGLIPKE